LLLAIFVLSFPALLNACGNIFARSANDWISIGVPPSGTASIAWGQVNQIWVIANNGSLYTTSVTSDCLHGQQCESWRSIDELPVDLESVDPNSAFAPAHRQDCEDLQPDHPAPNPNGDLLDCVYVLSPAGETFEFHYFALMSDGTVMFLDNTPVSIPWICF
jgi:hypothetical protein